MKLTDQQQAAIESKGKTIVSASAGSGKTFVMIRKLVSAICEGVDLDSVLAVTFTKKAAAQMKEKLRKGLIESIKTADEGLKARLKVQLSKISFSNISTIHSFCARLLRTYFYAVDIDSSFDIISADDAKAKEFQAKALENLFERYYAEDDSYFKTLLKYYRKKRSDNYLKRLIISSYAEVRNNADYNKILDGVKDVFSEEGFNAICDSLKADKAARYKSIKGAVKAFEEGFKASSPTYKKIFEEMYSALENAEKSDIFAAQLPLAVTRKPADKTDADRQEGERYKKFRADIAKKYKDVRQGIEDEMTERERFFSSGDIAIAFSKVLSDFDWEYAAVKRDEDKLDYNDLEHLTLKLLSIDRIREEINRTYSSVFVDEYQDVNPVQESIISLIGGKDLFLVGDVKQAIYGFRGSKSLFFAEKFNTFEGGRGNALRLSNNFRSSDGVLNFVNSLFSKIMTEESCGFDYSKGSIMLGGGGYGKWTGDATIHVFGKDEEEKVVPEVYSVKSGGCEVKHTREALAILEIVKRELKSTHFDLSTGEEVDTQAGDICILVRKNNKNATEIVRALTDAGYSVSGAKDSDVFSRPEVKEMLDILSYLDNSNQDIPLTTALLSPLGGLNCDELATIAIAFKGTFGLTFKERCKSYSQTFKNAISKKLNVFFERMDSLRDIAEVFSASEVINKILQDTGLEAVYSAGGGEKLKNLRRLAAEGADISVCSLLAKIKAGYKLTSPASASSDSIKIMTMHASKGLEFPVVIIADICATYKGDERSELPFDESLGFAPKYFDEKARLTHDTLLRKLILNREDREERKNEFNLFYVACTRAMCRLHIMAREISEYSPLDAKEANCYSKMFNMTSFPLDIMTELKDENVLKSATLISSPDIDLQKGIESKFMREYAKANSVNLPVKSSASAILKLKEEDSIFRPHELFSGEGETGTERGTAYHRFLELCDFSIKDREGIEAELNRFLIGGHISEGQLSLLSVDDLVNIVNMPVFEGLNKARLYREREFLCRLPANEIFDTDADDGILVQGAIDLLAETEKGYIIIDYKYSHKSDGQLIDTYSKQLALYRRAVSEILHIDENSIKTVIVNIFSKRQIPLN